MVNTDSELIERVAHRTYQRDMSGEDWQQALAIDGLISTDDSEFVDAARSLVDRMIEVQGTEGKLGYDDPKDWLKEGARAQLEAASLLNGVLEFYERTEDEAYHSAAEKHYKYLTERANRLEDGTISYATEPTGLWVDSIYLAAYPLVRYGDVTGTPEAIEEAVEHVRAQVKYLQDPHTGLFRHEWQETPNTYPESTFWLRGNGWAATGILNLLDHIPADHEDRDELVDVFRQNCAAVLERQDESGYWHHILDDPWTAKETSGTLQYSYAFKVGFEEGYLNDEVYVEAAERAFEVCKGNVDEEGNVTRVVIPPGGPDVPLGVTSYGQGWFLLAADRILD